MNEKLTALRAQIDSIDEKMIGLFVDRMRVAEQVADIKREENLPVFDAAREEEVVARARSRGGERCAGEAAALSRSLMALSKAHQRALLSGNDFFFPKFEPPIQPQTVAYQGVPGAFSHAAACKLYSSAQPIAFETFEDVFEAVVSGAADAGVVPAENTVSGVVREVYELIRQQRCFLAGELALPVEQCLLTVPGAQLGDIVSVLSHSEALAQCRTFLRKRGLAAVPSSNTAVAAETVARNADPSLAAIGSAEAAKLYGLEVLCPGIQDAKHAFTRFIGIAAQPVAGEDADRVVVTFVTHHHAGALADVLLAFSGAGLNIARILSQPDRSGGYRFFADIEGGWCEMRMRETLAHAANACEYFEVLGAYKGA